MPLEESMATHSSVLAWRIPMDRGTWWARIHGVTKSRTRLSDSAHSTALQGISWHLTSSAVLHFSLQLLICCCCSVSHVQLFVTPWTAACQASLSFTISQSLLKLMSIESMMPSNHLILCCPLLLLPSVFPSIRIFSNELALHIRWAKY